MIISYKKSNVAKDIKSIHQNQKPNSKIAEDFDPRYTKKAKRMLDQLDAATSRQEILNIFRGKNIHKITTQNHPYQDYYSVYIDNKWRLCFKWGNDYEPDGLDDHAYLVEICDHYGDGNS